MTWFFLLEKVSWVLVPGGAIYATFRRKMGAVILREPRDRQ